MKDGGRNVTVRGKKWSKKNDHFLSTWYVAGMLLDTCYATDLLTLEYPYKETFPAPCLKPTDV